MVHAAYRVVANVPSMERIGVQRVAEEDRPTTDGRGRYHRIGITCPLSNSAHREARPCHRWRNISASQTARYGIVEAFGFLGAWAAHAPNCTCKGTHKEYTPDNAEIDAWLLAHGYIEPR